MFVNGSEEASDAALSASSLSFMTICSGVVYMPMDPNDVDFFARVNKFGDLFSNFRYYIFLLEFVNNVSDHAKKVDVYNILFFCEIIYLFSCV